jgi:hypothetical protein
MNRKSLKQFQIKRLVFTGTFLLFGVSATVAVASNVLAQANSGISNSQKLSYTIVQRIQKVDYVIEGTNCTIKIIPDVKIALENLLNQLDLADGQGDAAASALLKQDYYARLSNIVNNFSSGASAGCKAEVTAGIAASGGTTTAATANLKLFPNSEQIGYGYYAPFDGSSGKNTTDFMKNRQQNLAAISASLANIDVKNLGLPSYFRLNTNVSPTEGKIEVVETQSQLNRFLNAKAKVSGGIGKFRASLDASYSGSSSFSEKEMRAVRKLQIPYYEIEMDIPALKRVLAAAAQLPPLPKDGNFKQFFQTYGTHFKSSVVVGGEATMTLKTTDSSKITKQEMSATLAARSTFVSGSASVNAGTAQTDQSKGFTFTVNAKGGKQDIAASLTNFDANKFNQWSQSVKDAALPIQEEYSPIWELYDGNDAAALKAAYEKLQNEVLIKPSTIQFSGKGALAGMNCTRMYDSALPDTIDNYLCTDDPRFFGFEFASSPAKVDSLKNGGYRCEQLNDGGNPHWDDNFLCVAPQSPLTSLRWARTPQETPQAKREEFQCIDYRDVNVPLNVLNDNSICYKVDQSALVKWRQDSLYE